MKTKFKDLKNIKATIYNMVRRMDPNMTSVIGNVMLFLKCEGDKTMFVDFQEKQGLVKEKIIISLKENGYYYKIIVLHTKNKVTIIVKDDDDITMNVLFSREFPSFGMNTITDYEIAYDMYADFVRYCQLKTVYHNDNYLSEKVANHSYWVHRNFPNRKLLVKIADMIREAILCDDILPTSIKIKQMLQKIFA